MKKTIIAAILFAATPAFADGNCKPVFAAKAGENEILTVKLPGKGDFNGPVFVEIHLDKADARIGGSASLVRFCQTNNPDAPSATALVYSAKAADSEIRIPIASKDAWVRVNAGGHRLIGFRSAEVAEVEVAVADSDGGQSQKKGE
jgi:hypothetical protein